jgi:nuclear cap-binding protein subunit 2
MTSKTARSGSQQTAQTSSRPSPSPLAPPSAPFIPSEHLSSPFLPPSAAATAPLSLSASLLFAPSPSHLLTSSYLQQRRRHYAPQAWHALLSSLSASSTLYLGNLAFSTREETVLEAAMLATQQLPPRLYMGVNAVSHTPCGFCFLSFPSASAARRARWWLDGLRVDGRLLQVDFDQEFRPGRQLGRGKGGGQIRDDHRSGFDGGRGGWGTRERRQQQMRLMEQQQLSHFRPMQAAGSELEEEKRDQGTEAGAETEAKVQQRRDNVSYAHASAMRRAGGAAAVIPMAAVPQLARTEPEAAADGEEEASQASQSRADPQSLAGIAPCLMLCLTSALSAWRLYHRQASQAGSGAN